VIVCAMCRQREVIAGAAGLKPVRIEDWPVTLARLVEEDRERLRHLRSTPVSEALKLRERKPTANTGG
jgi:hypothetical protein